LVPLKYCTAASIASAVGVPPFGIVPSMALTICAEVPMPHFTSGVAGTPQPIPPLTGSKKSRPQSTVETCMTTCLIAAVI